MKNLILAIVVQMSLTPAFAALGKDDVLEALAGKYEAELENMPVDFEIKANGTAKLETEGNEFASATLKLVYSSKGDVMNGLPVANLILSAASDEDATDFHMTLTVIEEDGKKEIRVINVFSTTNDGPNYWTSFEKDVKWSLKKYDSKSKQLVEIK
jgi:hypothetical protein